MKIYAVLLALLISINLHAQQCITAAWVDSYGGNSAYNGIIDGDRLGDGRFVVLGTFGNSGLTLDTFNLAPKGTYNVFMAVHDSSGSFHHAKVIAYGNGGYVTPTALDAGLDGRIHITGYYEGSSIYLNDSLLTPVSAEQTFTASFEGNLDLRWYVTSDRVGGDVRAYDVSGGPDGGVFITGHFEANAFRIGNDAVENAGGWNMWREDVLIVKFDSIGQVELMRSLGTPENDYGYTITADANGDFIVTGTTNSSTSTFKFDDQTGVPGSVNNYGFYMAKYDGSTGKCLWGKIGGGLFSYSQVYANDACRGENGSVYLTGKITGTVSLPPHSYGAYDGDAFLAKVDSQGNTLWLEKIGGQNSSEYGIDCSYYNGKVAVTGKLFSNYTYVGDFPLSSVPPGNSFNAFNTMFDEQGEVLWARGYDASFSSDIYPSVALIDDDGNQMFWGSFKGNQQWYPVSLNNTSGNPKLFLARFAEGSPQIFSVSAGQDKVTTCSSYATLDGSVSPSSVTFGWTPDLGFFNNGDLTPNVTPKKPTTYVLHAFYQGCTRTDTVHVDISNYGNLSADAGSDTIVCRGSSVQLGGSSGTSGVSYSWSPQAYLSSSTDSTPTADPPYPTEYILKVTQGSCEATDTVRVIPKELPYIYLPKQDLYGSYYRTHLCEGHPLEVDLGDPSNTYVASPSSLLLGASNNLITIKPQAPGGLLTVSATDSLGCSNQDVVNVIVHDTLAGPPINGSVKNRSACDGDSLILPVYITSSIVYPFQYNWYAGWQIDKGDGNGWQEVSIWDTQYDIYNYSYGYPTSSYYTVLRIPLVETFMDSFRIRCWVADYCSPRTYSNAGTITIGPKITKHPEDIDLCEGVTDSISVNSSSSNVTYHWEVFNNGVWDSLVNQPGYMVANGRFLRFENAQASLDSTLVRCRMTGCSPIDWVLTDSALIRVITRPEILWQSMDDSVCEGTVDSLLVITNDGPWDYRWYANNNPINYNTSQICCYTTNKLVFTPVYMIQNNYYYKLRISNTQCSMDTFSTPVRFFVSPTANASWPGGDLDFCEGDPPATLSGGSPAGGSYSGPGVLGNTFDPSLAGVGVHTVYYGYSGPSGYCSDSVSRTFTVHAAPTVSWSGGQMQSCDNEAPFPLSGGLPTGGVYSGTGVSNNVFDPTLAGTGTHTLTYLYTDPSTTCSSEANRTMQVIASPTVSWPSADTAFCLSGALPFMLSGGIPAGGSFSGPGVSSGSFDPQVAGPGLHLIAYNYLDPLTFCSAFAEAEFTLYTDPVVSWNGDTAVCLYSGPYTLTGAFPAGGSYYGSAVNGGQFDPLAAGLGYDTVCYMYSDPVTGCSDTVLSEIYVDPCTGTSGPAPGDFKLYRNNDHLVLESTADLFLQGELTLFNTIGQLVDHKKALEGRRVEIDVSGLPPGMYILQWQSSSGMMTRKVTLY